MTYTGSERFDYIIADRKTFTGYDKADVFVNIVLVHTDRTAGMNGTENSFSLSVHK